MGFFKSTERNYASIVAPLSKMKQDLLDYINEQTTKIQNLVNQKSEIEMQIGKADMEITKSENTAQKIASLLSLDLDEDGTLDVNEVPPEGPPVNDSTSGE